MSNTKLVDTKQLAEMLNCTQDTIHNLRNEGKIKGYKFVKRWRYDPQEVLKALEVEGQVP